MIRSFHVLLLLVLVTVLLSTCEAKKKKKENYNHMHSAGNPSQREKKQGKKGGAGGGADKSDKAAGGGGKGGGGKGGGDKASDKVKNPKPLLKPISQFDNPDVKPACTMAGRWYDQWGNEMVISEGIPKGNTIALEGKFASRLQFKNDAILHGSKSYDNKGVTFGIVVIFEGGSVFGFNGECYVVGKNEILLTSWLLRSSFPESDSWRATRSGSSEFRRYPFTQGEKNQ